MKRNKKSICVLLILPLLAVTLAACGSQTASASDETDPGNEQSNAGGSGFSYSDGIDDNGFWENITALDYVELFDYEGISIPGDVHTVSDDEVQAQVDSILSYYSTSEEVTGRAVQDGDTVNIDYVGSVDGVEFDGGSTSGAGTEVTIGVTSYIDDFLEQLIGHTPGETFDIEVTFPEDYGVDELNGKDAVFVTTVNYIAETTEPELTDEFVAENLSAEYGWATAEEMKSGIRADLQTEAVNSYLQEYIAANATVRSVPDQLMEYQENALVYYYEDSAASYGLDVEEFLSAYVGVSTLDELVESEYEYNMEAAKYYLTIQAIAEDAGVTVGDEDMADYFTVYFGSDDYSQYEAEYGLPYLKQAVLVQNVFDYLTEQAVLE